MTNKHYVVMQDPRNPGFFNVVCLAHDISQNLKRSEADALANALNLESVNDQVSLGGVEPDAMSVRDH